MAKVKCEAGKCEAFCCKYISVHIDAPRSKVDFDEIQWFVSHKNITVYKDDDDDWMVEMITPCKFLKRNRCIQYEKRTDVCRDYDPESCSHNSGEIPTQVLLKTPEDVEAYVAKRWSKKKRKKKKRKKKSVGKTGTRKKTGR